jgi:hypothetical protein
MYKTVIPLVQGLGYRKPASGEPSSLELVKSTYGVWDEALQVDPSGTLIQNTVRGAATSALIFAAIGYLVPGLTAVEGLKWGAITGGARSLYSHIRGT